MAPAALDDYLTSHAIDPTLLRADTSWVSWLIARVRLLAMVARATGHPVPHAQIAPEEGDDVEEDDEGFDLPAPEQEDAQIGLEFGLDSVARAKPGRAAAE